MLDISLKTLETVYYLCLEVTVVQIVPSTTYANAIRVRVVLGMNPAIST